MVNQDDKMKTELQRFFEHGVAAGNLHGMVVAIGREASPDFLWAAGFASVKPSLRPMTTNAVFDVASVTKVMATATACGLCIDRGLLDPDAPVRRYLPGCVQPPGPPLLVRDLATHTSGFDNQKFVGLPGDELLQQALTAPGAWPARDRYHYACRNFVLLGLIVEQLVGRTLAEFCDDAIFSPLRLSATAGYPLPSTLQDRLVPGIIRDGPDRFSMFTRAGRMLGHAGLYSSAGDLARFCAMMLGGGIADGTRILGERALGWLTRPCSPAGLPARSFGYDMRPASPPNLKVKLDGDSRPDCPHRPQGLSTAAYGHGGWTGQSVWIDPQRGLYIIILTNRTHCLDFQSNGLSSQLLRQQVGDVLLRHWT
jgi:CubicO group peptidase (beta-lactamase class C family)